jgi:hypothetical protein
MQSDSDVDAPADWQLVVPLCHAPLQDGSALHCINHIRELCEKAISREFEDAAVMLLDLLLEQLFAVCL